MNGLGTSSWGEGRFKHARCFMSKAVYIVIYIIIMVIVIVGVDLLFFKDRFWERLMANIGIVLLFAAFYVRFLK